jgi:hypothetical protein
MRAAEVHKVVNTKVEVQRCGGQCVSIEPYTPHQLSMDDKEFFREFYGVRKNDGDRERKHGQSSSRGRSRSKSRSRSRDRHHRDRDRDRDRSRSRKKDHDHEHDRDRERDRDRDGDQDQRKDRDEVDAEKKARAKALLVRLALERKLDEERAKARGTWLPMLCVARHVLRDQNRIVYRRVGTNDQSRSGVDAVADAQVWV